VGSCNDPADGFSEGGPEYVYRLRLNSARNVAITATPAGPDVDPVLYVRKDNCKTGVQPPMRIHPQAPSAPGCGDDTPDIQQDGGVEWHLGSQLLGNLTAGDYFIFVESYGTKVGPTHVTVSATP
jgi:hypothetical protein